MNALERAGHTVVPTLCAYVAFGTLMRSLTRVALDPEQSAQFARALAGPAALAVFYLVSGWAVFTWRRWAPFLAAALFGKYVYELMSLGSLGTRAGALAEAGIFTAAALWFLLPGVRAEFSHGRWWA